MGYRKIRERTTKSVETFTGRRKWRKKWKMRRREYSYAKTSLAEVRVRSPTLAPTRRAAAPSTHARSLRHTRCLGSFSRSNPSFIQGPIHFDRGTRPPRIDRHACARAPVTVERTSARTDYIYMTIICPSLCYKIQTLDEYFSSSILSAERFEWLPLDGSPILLSRKWLACFAYINFEL